VVNSCRKVKVVRVIARLNVGGPARHVVWLTDGLKDSCDTVLVTGIVPPGEDDMAYFAADHGLRPHVVPQMSREISLRDIVTVWKLYRLFVRECPDIVHTHTAKAGTAGRLGGLLYKWLTPSTLIGRPRKCQFVHTYHGHVFHSYYGSLKTRIFLWIERVLARIATDRIVVISRQQFHEISTVFRVGRHDQFRVIPLGLDSSIFADGSHYRETVRHQLGIRDDEIVVGIVGRLTEIKNHQLFLDVAALFKAERAVKSDTPPVRFVVIGDGKLRSRLEASAKALGFGEDLIFLGTRNDPERFYPAFDIVALTSLNEGTPLTLIEAMSSERACIATAVGGVVDLIGDPVEPALGGPSYSVCERGIVAPSGDVKALCRGLERLVNDEALRLKLGRSGRRFVEEYYSKDRLLADVNRLYEEITGRVSAIGLTATSANSNAQAGKLIF
jgi:glycosyltransferase involved in cell wall biosynthesis